MYFNLFFYGILIHKFIIFTPKFGLMQHSNIFEQAGFIMAVNCFSGLQESFKRFLHVNQMRLLNGTEERLIQLTYSIHANFRQIVNQAGYVDAEWESSSKCVQSNPRRQSSGKYLSQIFNHPSFSLYLSIQSLIFLGRLLGMIYVPLREPWCINIPLFST